MKKIESLIIGLSIIIGLFLLGSTLGKSVLEYKSLERTVVVKGLSQKEVKADVIIWPISYIRVSNKLSDIYRNLDNDTQKIINFLKKEGFSDDEISVSPAAVTDKVAQAYNSTNKVPFRYNAVKTLTLYSKSVDKARATMTKLSELGKTGISFKSNNYNNRVEYIYTKLNDVKPDMIKDATKNARASAQTFANDSQSKLGKIKSARQGQFSIMSRDANTPYMKKIRVVSTIEYYLTD